MTKGSSDFVVAAKHVVETRSPHLSFNVAEGILVPGTLPRSQGRSILRSQRIIHQDNAMGVKSIRPTWFEDETVARVSADGSSNTPEPMHGLRLIIKEDALPLREQPNFEALAEVASRGLLAAETWQFNRPHISLKSTIDVPLLGTEQNGDGLLEASLMPVQ